MKPQDLETLARAAVMQPLRFEPISRDLAAKVDRIGILQAVIASTQEEIELLRGELETAGLPHIEGQFFNATLTHCAGKILTDWRTVAMKFKPSPQLIRAYTKTSKESTRLTLTARKAAQ